MDDTTRQTEHEEELASALRYTMMRAQGLANHAVYMSQVRARREAERLGLPQFEVELYLPTIPVFEERNETV